MAKSDLTTTSFDADQIKQSLIDFLKSTDEFGDFNYEGSAINTMVDLLTRDTTFMAYLANMLANESFIGSAQLRANVVSHAEKLSYVPKTSTAARLLCTVDVTPSEVPTSTSIVMDEGSVFLASYAGTTYSFVTNQAYVLTYSSVRGTFRATDVELFQGQRLTNRFVYQGPLSKLTIPNESCDSSTLTVLSREVVSGESGRVYTEATSLDEFGSDAPLYFRSEDSSRRTTIEFGRDILGAEPPVDSTLELTYIATEDSHANGVTSLIPATTVSGYSNISVTVTTPSYGGSPREGIESIKFQAPKIYQSQDRALTDGDYIPILKQQFPFISSAKSWGGEENDPPQYGTVFISIISSEGDLVTNAVKQQMVSYVKNKNVGSITPTIVDPERFGLDLEVGFAIDSRKTNKTFNDLSGEIKSVIETYNGRLNDFESYFNHSTVVSNIRDITGIPSVVIYKKVFKDVEVLSFNNPVYTADFKNPITPGTVSASGFQVNINGTDHQLFDRDGIIYVSYVLNGETIEQNVGTVDYEEGSVEFTVNFITDEDAIRLYVETDWKNFYVEQNRVVYINSSFTRPLEGLEGR